MTTIHTVAPEASPRHGDYDPHLASTTTRAYWGARVAQIAIAVAVSMFDVVLIKTTIDLVLDLQEPVSWLLGVLVMIASVYAAFEVGFKHRRHQAEGGSTLGIWVALAGWIALGGAFFAMRYLGSDFLLTGPVVEGQVAGTDDSGMEKMLAFVLLLVFICTGVAAYFAGHAFNLTAQGHLRNRDRLTRLAGRIPVELGIAAHLAEIVVIKTRDVESQPLLLASANLNDAALADVLMAEARKQIALLLAAPESTDMTTIEPTATPRDADPFDFPSTAASR